MSARRRVTGPLSRAVIVKRAVSLADRQGLEQLSMRSLARELGVEAMSLYYHLANKDELLDAMVDQFFAELGTLAVGSPWHDELRDHFRAKRKLLLRHAWAIGLIDSRRSPGPHNLRAHDAVLGCLRAGGFSVRLAGHAFAVLDSYVVGFVTQEINLPADLPGMVAEIFQDRSDPALPHLQEFVAERASAPGYAMGEEFDDGLELILDGLNRRLA